jgi:hypothetical protein
MAMIANMIDPINAHGLTHQFIAQAAKTTRAKRGRKKAMIINYLAAS